ncbi:hypothetical protein [Saccharibacillus brassicae]|uniref:Uncharacterized protein n=1 Tax=Saccharibacillus brassicae TaxID=2583377 RepID=A0A4Y6UY29_SACBS|nr:hypothetical protein [Saccharibacillus brassicae]QDH22044.1 hypothetical protein FFV09_15050 [Saccharibacillus brassicae]
MIFSGVDMNSSSFPDRRLLGSSVHSTTFAESTAIPVQREGWLFAACAFDAFFDRYAFEQLELRELFPEQMTHDKHIARIVLDIQHFFFANIHRNPSKKAEEEACGCTPFFGSNGQLIPTDV